MRVVEIELKYLQIAIEVTNNYPPRSNINTSSSDYTVSDSWMTFYTCKFKRNNWNRTRIILPHNSLQTNNSCNVTKPACNWDLNVSA